MPDSNVYFGFQPSFRLIFEGSMAYLRSWPFLSSTNFMRSRDFPNASRIISAISIPFFSASPQNVTLKLTWTQCVCSGVLVSAPARLDFARSKSGRSVLAAHFSAIIFEARSKLSKVPASSHMPLIIPTLSSSISK